MHLENIVKRTLEIKDHRITQIEEHGDNLTVHLEAISNRRLRCGSCRRRGRQADQVKNKREFQHIPFWGIAVFLQYRPRRVLCPDCGLRREALPWADGKERMTKQLGLTLAIWAKLLAIDVVSSLFGVHWNTVYSAIRKAVSYGEKHRDMSGILYIGVDEISRKKGHHYLTNVYDLQAKTLLWSGKGRKEETLRQFFETHGETLRGTVQAVCCDMWAAYISVIREQLPDAVLVFDRFLLGRHLLDAVDTVRKEESRELKKTHPDLLTGTTYVFLKNPENLTSRQRERLGYIEKLNQQNLKRIMEE